MPRPSANIYLATLIGVMRKLDNIPSNIVSEDPRRKDYVELRFCAGAIGIKIKRDFAKYTMDDIIDAKVDILNEVTRRVDTYGNPHLANIDQELGSMRALLDKVRARPIPEAVPEGEARPAGPGTTARGVHAGDKRRTQARPTASVPGVTPAPTGNINNARTGVISAVPGSTAAPGSAPTCRLKPGRVIPAPEGEHTPGPEGEPELIQMTRTKLSEIYKKALEESGLADAIDDIMHKDVICPPTDETVSTLEPSPPPLPPPPPPPEQDIRDDDPDDEEAEDE